MAMRRAARLAALLAVLIVPAIAAASASGKVFVTNCTHADFKPKLIILACGDAGAYVQKLTWSKWNSTGASGKGSYTFKTCTPDCAHGGTKSYPAKVALSKLKSCPRTKQGKVFTELVLTFTGKRPPHMGKTFKDPLGCPF
jgi:hypothetical protein